MLRTLFNIATGASCVLCIVATIWWIRSYRVTDRWLSEMSPAGARSTLFVERGWIKFLDRCYKDPQSGEIFSTSFIGAIGVPLWVIVLFAAVLPTLWVIFWKRV